jgi:hypothetical protein
MLNEFGGGLGVAPYPHALQASALLRELNSRSFVKNWFSWLVTLQRLPLIRRVLYF